MARSHTLGPLGPSTGETRLEDRCARPSPLLGGSYNALVRPLSTPGSGRPNSDFSDKLEKKRQKAAKSSLFWTLLFRFRQKVAYFFGSFLSSVKSGDPRVKVDENDHDSFLAV